MLNLSDLFKGLDYPYPPGMDYKLSSATIDSRLCKPGSLFVALPGENVDGHDFVHDAFGNGAILALVHKNLSEEIPVLDIRNPEQKPENFQWQFPFAIRVEDTLIALQELARYWRLNFSLNVIGITGSVGKSTTKEVASAVLERRFPTLRNPGNLNNEIGLPLTLLHLERRHKCAVLEMGFYYPGEIRFLCEIAKPQVGVITNIGTVHAERAGSQEEIARGKAELVEALPTDGVAILNFDDVLVREMAKKTKARVFFYGLDERADLWADQINGLGLEGISFRLHYRNEVLHLRVPLIGRHSVHTVLRATAIGLTLDLTWQEIVDGLRSGDTQLRLVAVRARNGALILDDTYNASPQSTLAALNLLDEMTGYKIAVLGDMLELGRYEEIGHQMVGVRAAQVADEIVTVGERAQKIAESARNMRFGKTKINEFSEGEQVVDFLRHRLGEKDVVLVKGSRGMRMDVIVAELEERG
jgi:UDP-N-acetylmuramoyl-tripeptide--D-alanyl-D-alanine ligase